MTRNVMAEVVQWAKRHGVSRLDAMHDWHEQAGIRAECMPVAEAEVLALEDVRARHERRLP